ncbi:hypothetical protein FISHEDRAFT_57812 [Fistulina hepatica ATCC 64428]|uniref:Uncharacterized protein n=1 Tax=Fistulina hepatica ATCC 64428 TaxID=1128425 RepID=A0A0D7AHW2_9AGAR|nr:hypothetical protein FISHEDRAFT_57812 [Fistulina hepatica ATCC 64428]
MSLSKIQLESIDEALEQMVRIAVFHSVAPHLMSAHAQIQRLYGEVMWISADRSATVVTPAGRYIRDDTLLPSAPPRQDLYPPVIVDDSYVSEVRTRGRSRSNSAQSQNSSNTTPLFGSSRPRSSSSEPVRPLIAFSKVRDLQELMDVVPHKFGTFTRGSLHVWIVPQKVEQVVMGISRDHVMPTTFYARRASWACAI